MKPEALHEIHDRRLGKTLVALMALRDLHNYGPIADKTEILIELRRFIDNIEEHWNTPTKRDKRGRVKKVKQDETV